MLIVRYAYESQSSKYGVANVANNRTTYAAFIESSSF